MTIRLQHAYSGPILEALIKKFAEKYHQITIFFKLRFYSEIMTYYIFTLFMSLAKTNVIAKALKVCTRIEKKNIC